MARMKTARTRMTVCRLAASSSTVRARKLLWRLPRPACTDSRLRADFKNALRGQYSRDERRGRKKNMTQAIDSRPEKALSQAIKDRRATPSFSSDPAPDDDLKKILEAGLSAPNAHHPPPRLFVGVA